MTFSYYRRGMITKTNFTRTMNFILLIHVCLSFISCQSPNTTETTQVIDMAPDTVIHTVQEDYSYNLSYLTGHFDPSGHPDFVLVDTQYADRPGLYLHKDTYAAFIEMHAAALKEGVQLQIRSATRNFYAQKGIWERKWTGETTIENGQDASVAYPDPVQRAQMILKYSSMPGSSRHHWGSDIDLNAFDNSWFESGNGLRIYEWLSQHGSVFGFCQPYSAKGESRPYGYEEERWHWSYMPLSEPLTQMAADSLHDSAISGFLGSETAKKLHIVERYVLGINQECLRKAKAEEE